MWLSVVKELKYISRNQEHFYNFQKNGYLPSAPCLIFYTSERRTIKKSKINKFDNKLNDKHKRGTVSVPKTFPLGEALYESFAAKNISTIYKYSCKKEKSWS